MLQFYVNYNVGSLTMPMRLQSGPFATVELANQHRRGIAGGHDVTLCWIGVSRDETRQLVNDDSASMRPLYAPALISTAA
ncbi:MAG: hypothetical protein JNN33_16110 [Rhodospirillaceae bacterium]|jgi:hypothetical protein|nr:hypothetical protein [Rhodospirillaceae bacterium]